MQLEIPPRVESATAAVDRLTWASNHERSDPRTPRRVFGDHGSHRSSDTLMQAAFQPGPESSGRVVIWTSRTAPSTTLLDLMTGSCCSRALHEGCHAPLPVDCHQRHAAIREATSSKTKFHQRFRMAGARGRRLHAAPASGRRFHAATGGSARCVEPMYPYHAVQLASMSLLGPSFILDELPSINLFSHAVWEKFELSLMELRVVAVWGGALASSDRLLGWGGALASSDRLLGCGVRERGEGTM